MDSLIIGKNYAYRHVLYIESDNIKILDQIHPYKIRDNNMVEFKHFKLSPSVKDSGWDAAIYFDLFNNIQIPIDSEIDLYYKKQ